ncbi:EPM2AIP1 [Cordylochernes scorpioides]|uniref:EPM2AIP1 n=1 Tax=Cordylochernes scorpioides TaxID=51811 RepID=A0ABY6LDL9_9ARAC|nr:EPM2AIP1 [Cordylochernes scorpioides]
MKLILFQSQLRSKCFSHFKTCEIFSHTTETEFPIDFAIETLSALKINFDTRFSDFDAIANQIKIFQNPFDADIETLAPELQMEMIDLQCSDIIKNKYENSSLLEFYKSVPLTQFDNLHKFARFGDLDIRAVIHEDPGERFLQQDDDDPSPKPKQVNGRRDTNEWRTTEGKPICFHCGRPGHVVRYCRDRRREYEGEQTWNYKQRDRQEPRTFYNSRSSQEPNDDLPRENIRRYRSPSPYTGRKGQHSSPNRRPSQSPRRSRQEN